MSHSRVIDVQILTKTCCQIKTYQPCDSILHHKEKYFLIMYLCKRPNVEVSPLLENAVAPLYRKFSVPLTFLLISLSHALGQHSVTRTKISYSATVPYQVQPASAPCLHAELCGFPGSLRQCGYPQPTWVYPTVAELQCTRPSARTIIWNPDSQPMEHTGIWSSPKRFQQT